MPEPVTDFLIGVGLDYATGRVVEAVRAKMTRSTTTTTTSSAPVGSSDLIRIISALERIASLDVRLALNHNGPIFHVGAEEITT